MVLVKDWMTENVVTVRCRDPLGAARSLLMKHRIHQLPVLRNGKVAGIVTDRDLRSAPNEARQVEDVMTHKPQTTAVDESVDSVAHLLRSWRINALPVVTAGKLVGVISTSDVLDAFVAFSGVAEPSYRLVILPAKGSRSDAVRDIVERHHGEIRWLRSQGSGRSRELHLRLVSHDVDLILDALRAAGHSISLLVASASPPAVRKK